MTGKVHRPRLALLFVAATALSLCAQQPAPNEPYTPSVLSHGTLYVSGDAHSDGTGANDAAAQMDEAMHNLQQTLRGAGMDLANLVWMNIYLTDAHSQPAVEDVYWKQIGSSPPARTVLTVAALPQGKMVEINAIAVADATSRKPIWPAGWKQGPRIDPPAIQAGEMLYLSAQGGDDPLTGKLASNFSAETQRALDNVSTVLKTAGMSTRNVVWVNPYMSVSGQYDVMGAVYKRYFEFGNTPGRGTIQVVALPHAEHVAFSCIAGADLSKRKAVRPRNMPPSPTASPGILYGDTLYLSAKSGFIPGQGIVTPLFDLQLRQSMRNLLDGLEEVDMDFSNVVFSTVYLRDMKDAAQMNSLYGKFFKPPFPARSTLQQNFESGAETAEQISFIAVRK